MKNESKKIYTTALVFAIISLALIVFLIYPLIKGIKKNSNDLIAAKNAMVTLAKQSNETENFKKNYDAYKPNLEKIDRLFVDPANPVGFIEFLENTAANSNITSQISLPPYLKNSKQANQDSIVLQFSSKGSFSDVLNFLKKIELGPYLIEIENLTIQNLKDKVADATFTIKAFIKK